MLGMYSLASKSVDLPGYRFGVAGIFPYCGVRVVAVTMAPRKAGEKIPLRVVITGQESRMDQKLSK